MGHRKRIKKQSRTSTKAGMVHISEILPSVMAELIDRACKAGNPPPSFVTSGYDHPDDAPPPPKSPPSTTR